MQPPQVNGNTMSSSNYNFGHVSPDFRNSTSPGESPKNEEEAFASFEDSHFGTTNESAAKPKVLFYAYSVLFSFIIYNEETAMVTQCSM